MNPKQIKVLSGWLVFAIATFVYIFSAEPTGSLWDCGEFVAGAYKLQVVHPPGAPLFLITGRLFAVAAELFSNDPSTIAYAVNLMSALCSSFAAMFIAWITFTLGRLIYVGRPEDTELVNEEESHELSSTEAWLLGAAAVVAGLSTAFSTSIWFSAVEGEVYAMSTFFTALTVWTATKWYGLPKDPKNDSWLILSIFIMGLSVGVHLLSLLAAPTIGLLYYFKKYEEHNWLGAAVSMVGGLALLFFIQKIVISGVPGLWLFFDKIMVSAGLPVHSGLIPLFLFLGTLTFLGLRYAHRRNNGFLQRVIVALALTIVGYSTIGVVITRAAASTPINMSTPDNPGRLIPYVNREQYGERPLLNGPQFTGDPVNYDMVDRYDVVDGEYVVVDQKITPQYATNDKVFFPRMSDRTQGRPNVYRQEWMNGRQGTPTMAENIKFFVGYQLGWMYWRYFMWNFTGRQNGAQGFTKADKSRGNWISGIKFIDEMRLHNMDELPEADRNDPARNTYYFLPFLFGFLGIFYHFTERKKDFAAFLLLFLMAGIGITIQANQPPREPRERDYVLVGSFMTFCVWIGLAIPALYRMLSNRFNLKGILPFALSIAAVASAPLLMGFQNFDDHSRKDHYAARDYAANFLNSVEENAILFTYGDNDTYPLWYAQEVEGIRTDVRVVNLSLIAVDWYIDLLRRKINDSPPIKLTISEDAYRGRKRIQIPVAPPGSGNRSMNIKDAVAFVGEDHSAELGGRLESYLPAKKLIIPVDRSLFPDSNALSRIDFEIPGDNIFKGDLAVLDIIASNLWERPIYFAVTARQDALNGLAPYLQLEGMAQRIVPYRTVPPKNNPYSMIGLGRVATDKNHELFTEVWDWGNFDKVETFINHSYTASVQSMQLIMNRTVDELIRKGQKEKAVDVLDTYFEAFPDFNFTYSYNTLTPIASYARADAYEKSKEHIRILAKRTADELEFFESLDEHIRSTTFGRDSRLATQTMAQLLNLVSSAEDTELLSELETLFAPYKSALQESRTPGGGGS